MFIMMMMLTMNVMVIMIILQRQIQNSRLVLGGGSKWPLRGAKGTV